MYKQGMKLVDIADALKVPPGTVRRWKSTHGWDGERSASESERSDKEKMVIAHSLYLTGIISNESVRESDEYLKAILKRYKNTEIKKLNSFYL